VSRANRLLDGMVRNLTPNQMLIRIERTLVRSELSPNLGDGLIGQAAATLG